MAEKSGFFNALLVDNQYDRKYNADDYSDNLAVIIGNGVLRSANDDLKCTSSGMNVSVSAGRAWINGHYYYNDSTFTFNPTTAPIGGKRYDRIMLRLDNQVLARKISLVYVEGEASSTPTKPEPTRNNNVYDLVLADVFVDTNTSSVVVTDTREDESICGWIFATTGNGAFFKSLDASFMEWFDGVKDTLSSVSLFKKFTWERTLTAQASSVAFNIPQYDAETCFIEVYVNGIFDTGYTLNDNIITFDGTLIAGTVVSVNCYKSLDGTGIMSVADEITQLQTQVASILGVNKFSYNCTGLDDNIALSEIAQAIYNGSYTVGSLSEAAEAFLLAIGGNTYLGQLPAEAQVEIDVVGKLGATTPVAGAGTSVSRFRWFNIGSGELSDKRIIFNFSKCQKITVACAANTSNIIFYGTDLNIKNANVYAYSNGSACAITMTASGTRNGYVNFDDCRLSISTSDDAIIAENGNFTNCHCICTSGSANAICFDCKNISLIRLIGGTYYAYIGNSAKSAAVMNIASTETNAVILAQNINAPTVAKTGYTQKNLAVSAAGGMFIDGVVSTMTSTGATVTIQGQIWKSKR